ncbi:glutaredoxin family protein [Herminiimonas sp. NPDC097707]|uniref:glutaredoxin family protein n=1 Tax=Herminiimonas sp. NPDC097707 TaxID=3364007 RepID=UPI00383A29DD
MIKFTLYSRSYCHLCDDMLAALHALNIVEAHTVSVVDVDADESLLARYDELVPVLVASKSAQPARQLCHYFLDEAAVRTFVAHADSGADGDEV